MTLSLIVRRTIRASVERVFDAWTEPSQIEKWWGPANVQGHSVSIDLVVGGEYRIGNRLPDGSDVWIHGVFEVVERPNHLVYTWNVGEPVAESESERVSVRFKPLEPVAGAKSTEIIVVHERIVSASAKASHEAGWLGCVAGLHAFLEP